MKKLVVYYIYIHILNHISNKYADVVTGGGSKMESNVSLEVSEKCHFVSEH